MLIILLLLVLFFVFGGGYWGHVYGPDGYGAYRGGGIGLGAVLLIILFLYLIGAFGSGHLHRIF